MALCPSVCPLHTCIVSKRLDESSRFVARRFHFTCPKLCCKETQVLSKISVLSSETFSHTLDLQKIATTSRSCCQQNSSTVELVDDIRDDRRIVAVYDKSIDCYTPTPALRFVADFLYDLEHVPTVVVQRVDKISPGIGL